MLAYRLATLTAVVTFGQLLLGGLVHSTDSGLACPDWPTCHGTFFPPMVEGILYEWRHRLLGATVGLLTLGAAVLVLRRPDSGRPVRGLAIFAVVLIVIQGLIGRQVVVHELPPAMKILHLALSMVFFAAVIVLAFWSHPSPPAPALAARPRRFVQIVLAIVFAQIVLGAAVRHMGVALACVDLPLCRGALWPAGAHWTVYLQVLHRFLAVLLLGLTTASAVILWRSAPGRRVVRALALAAPIGIAVQGTLGVFAVLGFLPLAVVMGHVGVGAGLLALHVVLWQLVSRRPALGRVAETVAVTA